jgi:hypothetical protein
LGENRFSKLLVAIKSGALLVFKGDKTSKTTDDIEAAKDALTPQEVKPL